MIPFFSIKRHNQIDHHRDRVNSCVNKNFNLTNKRFYLYDLVILASVRLITYYFPEVNLHTFV